MFGISTNLNRLLNGLSGTQEGMVAVRRTIILGAIDASDHDDLCAMLECDGSESVVKSFQPLECDARDA
jgi:hypothetical protein